MFGSIRVMVLVTPALELLNKHPFASIKLDLQGRGMPTCNSSSEPPRRQSYLAMEFPEHGFLPSWRR
jgi:hypothetical protein